MLEAFSLELDRRESRLLLRLQAAQKVEESEQLTMLGRQARRYRAVSVALGTAFGVAATVMSTAWGVYHDARATAIDVASAAEAKAVTLDERVSETSRRHDQTAVAITQLRQDVDEIGRAVTRLVSMLEREDLPDPPPTARVRRRP